jgi:hypothetical protein
MRKTSLAAAAALVAAGIVVSAPPPPAAAVTETEHVLVTNQYGGSTCGSTNHQIQIANAMTGALVQDLNSPNSAFQIPNDAKPFDLNRKVVALWGGHSSYTGSNGIGVYDRTTNTWTTSFGLPTFERGGNGAHSVTVLPDGYFAVAQTGQINGGGSGYVAVVSPAGVVVDTDGLASAHGVEWDGSRTAVFAVGVSDLRKYTYSTTTHQLTQAASYALPGTSPGGHDLRRRRTDNDYSLTVNAQGYVFDPETATFSALLKSNGSNIGSGVKSVDQRFDGVTEYSFLSGNTFNFLDRASKTATFCLTGYKHGRWVYAAGDPVFSEDGDPAPPPPASSGIGYGFPVDSVDEVQGAGADLTYGSFWIGQWVTTSGWGGFRSALDKAIADGVTPVIQWYYWGDAISDTCYQTGCGSKNKTEWDSLAATLRNEIATKMQGRKAIVVLETEWHKNGMDNETTFDGWLRNQMDILRSDTTEDIDVALGWGHWANTTAYTTFTQAGQYADMNSTMILFSCVRETRAKYTGAVDEVVADATELTTRYAKPVIVSDFGLSTYSGISSGDPSYATYPAPKDCIDADNYETLQEAEYAEVFTDRTALAAAGVTAFVFRAYYDDWNRAATNDYHKIAERWFGIVRDTATDPTRYKASYGDVIAGIKAESGSGGTGGGGGGTDAEWSQEAESFTTKPVGGQCTSATASGGLCWNVWSNGTISTTITAATAGVKTLKVTAHGDPAGGVWPIMKVRVGGTEVMNLSVGSDQWVAYAAAVTLTAGTHTLEVEYTNDGSVDGNDRNLLVDVASIDPATRSWTKEAEAFTTRTTGGETSSTTASAGKFWNLWGNGYVENAMSVPYTSQHEIDVTARGSVAGGVWPIMKVYVDGTLVLTQTVSTATWTTYKIRRTLSGGTRTLRIEFTNDGVVGSEDRNLHLDVASLYT